MRFVRIRGLSALAAQTHRPRELIPPFFSAHNSVFTVRYHTKESTCLWKPPRTKPGSTRRFALGPADYSQLEAVDKSFNLSRISK